MSAGDIWEVPVGPDCYGEGRGLARNPAKPGPLGQVFDGGHEKLWARRVALTTGDTFGANAQLARSVGYGPARDGGLLLVAGLAAVGRDT